METGEMLGISDTLGVDDVGKLGEYTSNDTVAIYLQGVGWRRILFRHRGIRVGCGRERESDRV